MKNEHLLNKEYIIRLIYEYNPHLNQKKVEIPSFRRDLYFDLEKWLPKKQALAIVGLRRTGKTTIMRQLMENLEGAYFFSFDEEETQSKEVLVFVIDYLLNNLKARCIFLDEVHYVSDWEGVLKRYYDQSPVKFILSGSESLEISKSKSALAGRLVTFKLESLSFREYLGLKGKKIDIRGEFLEDLDKIESLYEQLLVDKEIFEEEFLEYIYKGSFPELFSEYDPSVVRKYIGELVIRKIIYRDIPATYDIRRKDLLYELFRYVCANSSSLFEIKNLCTLFQADYDTVSNYLFYLRSAFLVRVAESYSKSLARRMRKNKKIYVTHPSLAFATLGYTKDMLVEKILGQYVETLFAHDFFFRDARKNEVDVVRVDRKPLPIEIKYQSQISPSDFKGIFKFMGEFDLKEGIIVTKDLFERRKFREKEILFIPAWLFLLIY
jgi:predicted AAA+ superfamily ATPase